MALDDWLKCNIIYCLVNNAYVKKAKFILLSPLKPLITKSISLELDIYMRNKLKLFDCLPFYYNSYIQSV